MKRRDFVRLFSLAGVAAALPAPLAALAKGPLDEELPLKVSLNGCEVHSVEICRDTANITQAGDELESFVPVGSPKIHLELNRTPPERFRLSNLIDLEIKLNNTSWRTEARVTGLWYRCDGSLAVDLMMIGE